MPLSRWHTHRHWPICRWAELLKLMNNIGRQIPLASEMWTIRFIVHIAVRCINLLISMLMALTSKSETGLYSSWMHGARTPSAHSAQFNKFYFFFIIIVTNILFDLFSLSLALFRVAKNIEKKNQFMFHVWLTAAAPIKTCAHTNTNVCPGVWVLYAVCCERER